MRIEDLREFKTLCPICGSPHLEIMEMRYEWMRHDKLVTITFECEACRSTIIKEFMNPSVEDNDPYGFFAEDVKNHVYRRWIGKP